MMLNDQQESVEDVVVDAGVVVVVVGGGGRVVVVVGPQHHWQTHAAGQHMKQGTHATSKGQSQGRRGSWTSSRCLLKLWWGGVGWGGGGSAAVGRQ